jgi:hypothetical protein
MYYPVRRIVTLGVEILGDDRLGVQVIGGRDIVASNPESGLSITYRKDGLAPYARCRGRH